MELVEVSEEIHKLILGLGGTIPKDLSEMKQFDEEGNPLWCVYMHTSPSGKVYVGITSRKPSIRWGLGGSRYKKQKIFYDAIAHYGWDSFKHEILSYNLTEQTAKNIEVELIKLLKANNREYGYNYSLGGDLGTTGLPSAKRKKIICLNTLEVFSSLTDAANRYNISMASIRKHLLGDYTYAGKDNSGMKLLWAYYDPKVKYTKLKYENQAHTKIICISTLQIFNSISEAIKRVGINRESMRCHLNGKSKYCGLDSEGNGLIWERYDPNKKYIKKIFTKEEIRLSKSTCNKKIGARPVICLFNLKVYSSASEAGRAVGVDNSKICAVCNGRRHSAGVSSSGEPLLWEYYDPNKQYTKKLLDNQYKVLKKKVLCVETGKLYDCASSASKELNIPKHTIYDSCHKGMPMFGYHFRYVD